MVGAVEGGLTVSVEDTKQHIGVWVAAGVGVAVAETQTAVGVIVGRLRIPDVLPESPELEGVGAPYLGDGIAGAGHPLARVKPLGLTSHLKPPFIPEPSTFPPPAPSAHLRH